MVPKGGTLFLLLILVCHSLGKLKGGKKRPDLSPPGFMDKATKLMLHCRDMGYTPPMMPPMVDAPGDSKVPDEDRRPGNNTFLSSFESFLSSIAPDGGKEDSRLMSDESAQMDIVKKMSNFTLFASSIKELQKENSTCYSRAFASPMCWKMVIKNGKRLALDEYEAMLWCAEPMLMAMGAGELRLPSRISAGQLEKLTNILQKVCVRKSMGHKTKVLNWVKEQVAQKFFDCTLSPEKRSIPKANPTKSAKQGPTRTPPTQDPNAGDSDPALTPCSSDLKWLNVKAMKMLGPCLLHVSKKDAEGLTNETLCEFFTSDEFKEGFSLETKITPPEGRRFLQKISDCFQTTDSFARYVERLGAVACFFKNPPKKESFAKKLLPELQECENRGSKKLKKELIKSLISLGNVSEIISEIGEDMNQMPHEELAKLPKRLLQKILKAKDKGDIKWSPRQKRKLFQTLLGNKVDKDVTGTELLDLQSALSGAPRAVFKNIDILEVLGDEDRLETCKYMKNWQKKIVMREALKKLNASELVMKMKGPLVKSITLGILAKAKLNSLAEVEGKEWSLEQALLLARRFNARDNKKFRRLKSIVQGITCKMINKVLDKDSMDFAQALTDAPQWLSKLQLSCIAGRLFKSLEKERPDYFSTITEEELDDIPTLALFSLRPSIVKKLPNSVCGLLLDKIAGANLTLVPKRAPSRHALTQKALLCLINGKNMSALSVDDLNSLGPLLCEVKPDQLALMEADVKKEILKTIGSCPPIRPHHGEEMFKIIKELYGDPSEFTPEIVTALGQLVLSKFIITALRNTPEIKESVTYILDSQFEISDAVKEKLFLLTTESSSAQRKKRAATRVPMEQQILELGEGNNLWTAGELLQITAATFNATVETLGAVLTFSTEQLSSLKTVAIEALGPVDSMTEDMVLQMGCINAAFSDAELKQLPLHLDTLDDIGQCAWNQSQIEAVWTSVAKRDDLTAASLDEAGMSSLDTFFCGLSMEEFGQLNMDNFKEALDSIGKIKCSLETTEKLKDLLVSVYGEPSSWTAAYIANLGNILVALTEQEWRSLSPEVFAHIKPTCIELIPPENIASFSVEQLLALGPDNAAKLTVQQRASLTPEKLAALEAAATGDSEAAQRIQGGAPTLSVEGISAFMKPFLFLLLGFLLL
ncbi:otoancorin [Genypterus blacodes]|uniref:otoancorin n=1 Tax=Genypterus blacodes TaxID=154954 RepID=UPI003F757534